MRHRQPLHELGQIAVVLRPEHEVPMVGHHQVAQNPHRLPCQRLPHHALESRVVAVVAENSRAGVRAVDHVKYHSPRSYTGSSWHGPNLPQPPRRVNNWTYPLFFLYPLFSIPFSPHTVLRPLTSDTRWMVVGLAALGPPYFTGWPRRPREPVAQPVEGPILLVGVGALVVDESVESVVEEWNVNRPPALAKPVAHCVCPYQRFTRHVTMTGA